jgi:1-acyl-sn-glycerol-3-phosphate acyltransferase
LPNDRSDFVNNTGRRILFFPEGRRSALVEFEYLYEKQKLGGMAKVVPW